MKKKKNFNKNDKDVLKVSLISQWDVRVEDYS